MELVQIIEEAARRMACVKVDIQWHIPTVRMSTDGKEDIFIQGEDAVEFITEGELLDEHCCNVDAHHITEDEIARYIAEPFAANIWRFY